MCWGSASPTAVWAAATTPTDRPRPRIIVASASADSSAKTESPAAPAETISEIGGAADVGEFSTEAAADTTAAASTEDATLAAAFAPALTTDAELRDFALETAAALRTAAIDQTTAAVPAESTSPADCTALEGVPIGPILWQGTEALAFLVPDVAAPNEVLVVSPGPDCTIVTTVALG